MQSLLQRSLRRSWSRTAIGFIAATLLVAPVIAEHAGPVRLTVRNPEPPALRWLLKGNRIEAMLRDGTYVKAGVRKVEGDRLLLNVEDFDGPSALMRGEREIALSRFSTITVTKYGGCKRAVFAFTLGALGTAAGLMLALEREDTGGGKGTDAAVVGLSAGSIAGGYLLGRHLDKKEITIIID